VIRPSIRIRRTWTLSWVLPIPLTEAALRRTVPDMWQRRPTRAALTGLTATATATMLFGGSVIAGPAAAATDTKVPWKVYFGHSSPLAGNTGGLRVMSNANRSMTTPVPLTQGYPVDIVFTPNSSFAFLIGPAAFGPTGLVTPMAVSNNRLGAPLKVGGALHHGAITPDGKRLYVTGPDIWDPQFAEGSVEVIDVPTRTPVASIDLHPQRNVEPRPTSIAITPDGAQAWSFAWNQVMVIDTATNTVLDRIARDDAFYPYASGVAPDGSGVYVTASRAVSDGSGGDVSAGFLLKFDPQTRQQVDAIPVPGSPVAMAISANGRVAYIATTSGWFYSVNLATRQIGKPAVANVVNSPSGRAVPVTLATGAVGASIPLGDYLQTAAVAPDQAPVTKLALSRLTSRKIGFDATASTVKYGKIARLTWDFGDGTRRTTVGAKVTHTYARAGAYTVSVTAVSQGGTSTTQVFTGQGMLRNGGPQAKVTKTFTVR
jgi:hypothetical protein